MDDINYKTQTKRETEAHPQIRAYNPHGRGLDWQGLSAELESSNDGRTDSLSEQGWVSSQGVLLQCGENMYSHFYYAT